MANKKTIAAEVTKMWLSIPTAPELKEERLDAYYEGLKDLTEGQVIGACSLARLTRTSAPSVAELRTLADGIPHAGPDGRMYSHGYQHFEPSARKQPV